MKNVLKWIGIGLGVVVVVASIAVASLVLIADNRLNKTYAVAVESIPIPADPATIERGQHIVTTVCVGCHDENLGGKPVLNAPGFAVINASNLTRGEGGVGNQYKDEDWVRAIRHGVDPDGKSLLLMPAPELFYLRDLDLAAAIAYVKSVPPADNKPCSSHVRWPCLTDTPLSR